MALTGHLSDLSLSELIEFFCNQRKTGQLKVLYPQGHGYFFLQTGSVVDARIGVLRGIDAVYFALTLPNAKFEFGSAPEPIERTINQPWTQVVLEGLRRLDEGVIPAPAFPDDYVAEERVEEPPVETSATELKDLRVPAFLSFMSKESVGQRRNMVVASVVAVVLLSVAAIGVPAGWYRRAGSATVIPAPVAAPATESAPSTVAQTSTENVQPEPVADNEAAIAAKRQRERERAKTKDETREERSTPASSSATAPAPSVPVADNAKPGPKKITVTVTYDESGRVTQASGGDAGAVRIARQKRFPAGKAGSATITIPVN